MKKKEEEKILEHQQIIYNWDHNIHSNIFVHAFHVFSTCSQNSEMNIFFLCCKCVDFIHMFVARIVDADASVASAIYCAKGNELLWNVNLKQRNRS